MLGYHLDMELDSNTEPLYALAVLPGRPGGEVVGITTGSWPESIARAEPA